MAGLLDMTESPAPQEGLLAQLGAVNPPRLSLGSQDQANYLRGLWNAYANWWNNRPATLDPYLILGMAGAGMRPMSAEGLMRGAEAMRGRPGLLGDTAALPSPEALESAPHQPPPSRGIDATPAMAVPQDHISEPLSVPEAVTHLHR